ncbi:uncharacterized protein LOC131145637 [Malania oleifera]|uniref:uncharacterized protein LOC131145637 n=1 Tax=Malania oleifera TaxID=397392 RepID=UPI0025ADD3D6|nr:uncharacterized protein LOC131145637 [Malania oleifera]
MENLPADLYLKIFCLLDHQNLATAQQVCRKWKLLASDNILWSNLFKERWGGDRAAFFAPSDTKSWKDVYEVQDRCERIGLGLKIIREGEYYYVVHQGEIQRCLGSRRRRAGNETHLALGSRRGFVREGLLEEGEPCEGILDRILFFIGDLEVAMTDEKRRHML